MMPRGAGRGTSRSRFPSDCNTYCSFFRTCVLKKALTRSTKEATSTTDAERPRRATSFGWKLTGRDASGGRRLEQGAEQHEEDDPRQRRHGRREGRPDERLHDELGAVRAMLNGDEQEVVQPLAQEEE